MVELLAMPLLLAMAGSFQFASSCVNTAGPCFPHVTCRSPPVPTCSLEIRQGAQGVYMPDLTEIEVHSVEQGTQLHSSSLCL